MSPIEHTENYPVEPHPVHNNLDDFENHFNGEYEPNVPMMYRGNPFEDNQNLPNIAILLGKTGSGKDTVLDEYKSFEHIKTANTRQRRVKIAEGLNPEVHSQINHLLATTSQYCLEEALAEYIDAGYMRIVEPVDAYIWFRPQRQTETTIADYRTNLCLEYNLVEFDSHNNIFYGLPAASMDRVLEQKRRNGIIPVIRTNPTGAATIMNAYKGLASFLVVNVLPDNKQIQMNATMGRAQMSNDELMLRIKQEDSLDPLIQKYAHFHYHNTRGAVTIGSHTYTGLELIPLAFDSLFTKLKWK